ncbi:MAG: hypothetical protein WC775_05320 [Patescibacteria group bacterium]|jgi:hypothetical protein
MAKTESTALSQSRGSFLVPYREIRSPSETLPQRDALLYRKLIEAIWRIDSVAQFLDYFAIATQQEQGRSLFSEATLRQLLGNMQRDLVFFVRDAYTTFANIQGVGMSITEALSDTVLAAFNGMLWRQYDAVFTKRDGCDLRDDFDAGNPLLMRIINEIIAVSNKLVSAMYERTRGTIQQTQVDYYCHVVQTLFHKMILHACDYLPISVTYNESAQPRVFKIHYHQTPCYSRKRRSALDAALFDGKFAIEDAQLAEASAARGIIDNGAPVVISQEEKLASSAGWRLLRDMQLNAPVRVPGCCFTLPDESELRSGSDLLSCIKMIFK